MKKKNQQVQQRPNKALILIDENVSDDEISTHLKFRMPHYDKITQKKYTTKRLFQQIDQMVDKNNPQIVSSYFKQIYLHLKQQESKNLNCWFPKNFRIKQFNNEDYLDVRAKYVDSMVTVMNALEFRNSSYYVVKIFDKMVEMLRNSPNQLSKQQLDTYQITSLLIAFKYCEIYPPQLLQLLYLLRSNKRPKDIYSTECKFLAFIKFNMIFTTEDLFLQMFLSILRSFPRFEHSCRLILEIGLLNAHLNQQRPSLKALAAIYYVNKNNNADQAYPAILKRLTGYDETEVYRVCKLYRLTNKFSHQSQLFSVQEKYQDIYRNELNINLD